METTQAPSREQLLYWLHEASEIEHNLMCCYLYAAFSLKVTDERWSPTQLAAVQGWRRSITTVALEEMSHLCLVGNIVNALGGTAHFNRPNFPIGVGPYPAGFVIRLQPFSEATIAHFQFLERPHESTLSDASGFTPEYQYQRGIAADRLSPGPSDYSTVGELYTALRNGLEAFAAQHGEAMLFLGDRSRQVDESLAPLPGVRAVTDLKSVNLALDTIVTQGEGAGDSQHDSHFCRFTRIAEELTQLKMEDPGFEPAWHAATNPVMNRPPIAQGREYIEHPIQSRWLDIGNALYATSLRCLVQGFSATERATKATWLSVSIALMRALNPVGQGLAARPAHNDNEDTHAGLTFTALRTLSWLPEDVAARQISTRLGELRERAIALPMTLIKGETPASWQSVIEALTQQQSRLKAMAGVPVSSAPQTQPAALIPVATTPVASSAPVIEIAEGKSIAIEFEARRCIHARHCVLGGPSVFKANTPGTWIYPDTMHVESVVTLAHQCPSGAIQYRRRDGGPEEQMPPVNTLHLRENGPYAVKANIQLTRSDGEVVTDGTRATLCRCGQSKRKPWCDGSHVTANFAASGEPLTGNIDPLAVRDGKLVITPLHNGPLKIEGSVEICAGTGRTVARIKEARLCRCGHSQNKPFCDLSHAAVGFEADGV
jgi:CDGSH-type Zn-finger protein/uncharacterized Fe-S cluster protein YjdI